MSEFWTFTDIIDTRMKLDESGFCLIPDVLTEAEITGLLDLLAGVRPGAGVRQRAGSVYGIRDLLTQVPDLRCFAESPAIKDITSILLGRSAKLVRAIYFDKTGEANWKVAWHQDATIATQAKLDAEGFNLWTVKSGIPHVRPPAAIMQRMLSLRIHLDDSTIRNGALKVIPGSHRGGYLSDREILDLAGRSTGVVCEAKKGSVMAMKPLLVHSSFSGTHPHHRRILHFEFSLDRLPGHLEWHDAA